jgi:hypothetical protein
VFCNAGTVLTIQEAEALDELEELAPLEGGGPLHNNWFNFLKAFSYMCFNSYTPENTGIPRFLIFFLNKMFFID